MPLTDGSCFACGYTELNLFLVFLIFFPYQYADYPRCSWRCYLFFPFTSEHFLPVHSIHQHDDLGFP